MTQELTSILQVRAGRRALSRIRGQGFAPSLFTTWLGASGGPKWLVLSGLDRVLAARFLPAARSEVALVGSSIGSWRHACLAQRDPAAAIERFVDAYIAQRYEAAPTPAEVTAEAARILDHVLGAHGAAEIVAHPTLRSHVIASRCRGLLGSERMPVLALALGLAAACNFVSRRALGLHFERAVFHTGDAAQVVMHHFTTRTAPLTERNLRPALLASGAIPLVLAGIADIEGAPAGVYRDGGIVDYHFDFAMSRPEGLCLFPHFSAEIVPGWFDKQLPWRRLGPALLDDVVILSPAPELVRGLSGGKIPDRKDFATLRDDARMDAWRHAVRQSDHMGDALQRLLDHPEPARFITPL